MSDLDPIAAQLREEREARGLTRADVARLTGIPKSAIADSEQGKSSPPLGRVRLWAEAFGLRLVLVEAPTETTETTTEEEQHG
jgi:transcriptional regulator with XRE-family HTH domain